MKEEEFDFDIYDEVMIHLLDTTLELEIKGSDLSFMYQVIFWSVFDVYCNRQKNSLIF